MENLSTFVPLLTSVATFGLTAASKHFAVSEDSENRAALVRSVAAIWAVFSAVLMGTVVDASAVEVMITAVVSFIGSLGIFHSTKKA